MQQYLAYFNVTVVSVAITFVATLLFGQKIKDFLNGVPADLRKALNTVEDHAKVDLKVAASDVVSKIAPAPKVAAATQTTPAGAQEPPKAG